MMSVKNIKNTPINIEIIHAAKKRNGIIFDVYKEDNETVKFDSLLNKTIKVRQGEYKVLEVIYLGINNPLYPQYEKWQLKVEMLQSTKMCPNYSLTAKAQKHTFFQVVEPYLEKGEVPQRRTKCDVCGRKVLQRICWCHDGCCFQYLMPPHKIKEWYKKPKKASRDNKMRRIK